MNLQEKTYHLFENQIRNWNLAKKNYEDLDLLQTKRIQVGKFEVQVQFNPARINSTGAKIDAKSIANRKCFLCKANQPSEEEGIDAGNYSIHVNPYPIFQKHLVFAHKEHIPQQLSGHFIEMLHFAKELPDFAIFFNGINCGASAPDHLHFQAAEKKSFPILSDYPTKCELTETYSSFNCKTYSLNNYFRSVFCIESESEMDAQSHIEHLLKHLFHESEPMLNILCSYHKGTWLTFVFPRKKSRPWQYEAPEPETLTVSPGTAEMSGIIVIPQKEHFLRINANDIIDIYQQVTL